MAALADLPDLTARISEALTRAGISHAVSGAMAMAAHGFVRATRDVDVLVAVSSLRLPEVFEIVRTFGFEGEDPDLIRSYQERALAELTSGPASVEILAPVLPLHRAILGRAVRIQVSGVDVPFVALEDLVVLKLLWLREKDRADLRALLAARIETLDTGRIEETLRMQLPGDDPRLAQFATLLRQVR